MRIVIQRCTRASVTIAGQLKSEIGQGMIILLGIEDADTDEDIDWLCRKIVALRIFDDADGVMNLPITDVPDSDPLLFYRAIGQYAATHLSPQGLLALEINQALSAETAQLLQALGFDTQLHHDFRGNPRCITASMPSCNTKE